METSAIPTFRRALLRWYEHHRRELPWRTSRDPYAIWLSEVMLQQTTVRTVETRWRRFLDRWPTVGHLAGAPLDDVLHEWTGLGYYARARNLHKAARFVTDEFAGRFPATFEELLDLPGLGVYTAAAVASIAFGEPVPVVDANVERVLARFDAIDEDTKSAMGRTTLRTRAAELLDRKRPGDFNQAMMELGALVCLPRRPACDACPVAGLCEAKRLGTPEAFPRMKLKPPVEEVREVAVVIERVEKVLLLKRRRETSFGGMWELPRVRCFEGEGDAQAAIRAVRELAGLQITPIESVFRCRHTVMNCRIALTVFTAALRSGKLTITNHDEARWIAPEEWMRLPKSTTQAKIAIFLRDRLGKGSTLT